MNTLLGSFSKLALAPTPVQVAKRTLATTKLDSWKGPWNFRDGFSKMGKYHWRNGNGMNKGYYRRIRKEEPWLRQKEFAHRPSLTKDVDTLPMFWMMDQVKASDKDVASKNPQHHHSAGKPSGVNIQDSDDMNVWKRAMYDRGFENPARAGAVDGSILRYKKNVAQRYAQRKRIQLQYQMHLIRLKALHDNKVLPKVFRRQAQEFSWMMNNGRFRQLKKLDKDPSTIICRIHGRHGGNLRPRFGIKRQPMRLLIDYNEGVCGIQNDFWGRRQREFYTDFLRRDPRKKRHTARWWRDETYYRYRQLPSYTQSSATCTNSAEAREMYPSSSK
ncbi:unnamed protein product [Oikopleura dioica]|uniref:Uncharacterized protein n=1 Tax=Oikopleura dioica TaxID=34765 RepID=E4XB81_OIKDI|nr:unnamed protein product [Oikopleura dioica]